MNCTDDSTLEFFVSHMDQQHGTDLDSFSLLLETSLCC